MNDSNERLQARLRALRSEFDQSFAVARKAPLAEGADYLLIRVAGEPYALRLAEVAALEADRSITPVPSANPALLGIAGLRGALVAVFDLARLLGHAAVEHPRWLVSIKGSHVAVAFAEFEAQRRLQIEALATATESGRQREVLRDAGLVRPIIELAALAASCEPPLAPGSGEEMG